MTSPTKTFVMPDIQIVVVWLIEQPEIDERIWRDPINQ